MKTSNKHCHWLSSVNDIWVGCDPKGEKWDLKSNASIYDPNQTFYIPPNFITKTQRGGKNHLWSEVKWSRSVMSNSLQPHRLGPTRLFCPWDFLRNSTGVDCHFLLQGIFPTQGWNTGLPHCRQTLYHLSHQGSPYIFLNLENIFQKSLHSNF